MTALSKFIMLILAAGGMLSGCASSDFHEKALHSDTLDYTVHVPPSEIPVLLPFNESPALRGYIKEVTAHNRDLKTSMASIQAFSYAAHVAGVSRWPEVNAGFQGERDNQTLADNKPLNRVQPSMNVSWTLDIWNKLSDQTEAEQLRTQQAYYNYENTRRALIAEAMTSWLNLWQLTKRETLLGQRIKSANNLLKTQEDRYAQGLSSYGDMVTQRDILQQLREQDAVINAQILEQLYRLNILRGQPPQTDLNISKEELSPVLTELPVSIPATVLAERPDIQSAFADIQILDKETSAAYKALLPQITLSGEAVKSGTTLANAMSGNILWQLVGGITQPVFNAGSLRSQARQKSKEAESAFYTYEQKVLLAMEEVQNALQQEQALAMQEKLVYARWQDLQKKQNSRADNYRDGAMSVEDYLSARQEALSVRDGLFSARAAYLKNRITLAVALGQELGIQK